jgi:hypothetical protein
MIEHAQSKWKLLHITSIDQVKKHDASWLGNNITSEEATILWEEYWKATLDPLSVLPVDHAIEWIRRLYDMGKNLSIVTARSNQESWKVERTLRWVHTHIPFLSQDDVYFVNHFSSDARPKSDVCIEKWITLLIDDALENAYELTHKGIPCLLLEKPWNRDITYEHPLLYRVKDWNAIIHTL